MLIKHKILMLLLVMAIIPIPRCAMAATNITEPTRVGLVESTVAIIVR